MTGEPEHLLDGKYKIERRVGVGAWGEVFEGVNVRIGRRVAIKVLKSDYASNAGMVARVEREARASTLIESPHVVQVFDAGVLPDGRPFIVMEFLTGPDLAKVLHDAGGKLPLATAVEFCMQASRGLAAAHTAGIFHRDMKPSNIVIAKTKAGRDVAKIVDFGISKALDVSGEVSATQTGVVLGSPLYMSPEQARGSKSTDQRSDIYSLGLVLYECLAGQPPHSASNIQELFFKIALEPIPSVKTFRPEVDDVLEGILQKLLAKDPAHRFQFAAEVEDALTDWLRAHGGSPEEMGGDSARRVRTTPTQAAGLHSTMPVQLSNSSGPRGSVTSDPGAPPAYVQAALMSSATRVRSPLGGSSSATAAPGLPAPSSRWVGAAAGGVGLVLAMGILAVFAYQRRTAAGSDAGLASATVSSAGSATASVSATIQERAPDPTPSTQVTASTSGPSAAPPGTWKSPPRTTTQASSEPPRGPASSAATARATPSAAPSVKPTASVGGRTIRTDL